MNPFQAQYPLSPRKFWKKLIPNIVSAVIFGMIIGLVVCFIPVVTSSNWVQDLNFTFVVGIFFFTTIVVAVIISALYAWYFRVYIRTYFYEGGDNFITIRKRVFTPQEIHVQYAKIQDVYVDQDLLDRIMGLYDVHIASATMASSMEAHIDGVDKTTADGLKNFFLQKIQGASTTPSVDAGGQPSAPVPQFNGDISSTTYPIQPSWMVKGIIGSLLSSLFLSAVVSFAVTTDKHGNPTGIPFVSALVVIFVVVFVFHLVGLLLWKKNYSFVFLPEYIQFHTGVLSLQERHLPYKSIQDVGTSQSILDRIFGLLNVTIENAAQMGMTTSRRSGRLQNGITLVGQTPEQAAKITEALKSVLLTKNSSGMGL